MSNISPETDFDSALVEPEEDDGDIVLEENDEDDTDEVKQLVDCTCDCDPTDHDEDSCTECDECTGHWE